MVNEHTNRIAVGIYSLTLALLPCGLTLSTATQLRPTDFPLGPGEMILIVWMIACWLIFASKSSISVEKHGRPFVIFWTVSILIILIRVALPYYEWDTSTGSLHDFMALLFVYSIIITFSLIKIDNRNLRLLFRRIAFINIISFGILFIVSIFIDTFNTIEFWHGPRFTAWATNPNQIALALTILPFIAIELRDKSKKFRQNVFFLALCIVPVIVGLFVLSDALIVAWVAGFGTLMFFSCFYQYFYKKQIGIARASFVYLGIPILILIMSYILGSFIFSLIEEKASYIYYAGKNQGELRMTLWANGIEALLSSPILGNGPGAHSGLTGPFQGFEVHNSFIDWGASTGIVGLVAYIWLGILIFYKVVKARNPLLISALITILSFTFFHYTFRQPLFWLYLLIIYGLCQADTQYCSESRKNK